MTRLPDLRAALDALGVRLGIELVIDAPRGILTPAVVEVIRQYQTALLVDLARERQWAELSPLRWGDATEDDANLVSDGACRDLDTLKRIIETNVKGE